jgi:hypothetical protein
MYIEMSELPEISKLTNLFECISGSKTHIKNSLASCIIAILVAYKKEYNFKHQHERNPVVWYNNFFDDDITYFDKSFEILPEISEDIWRQTNIRELGWVFSNRIGIDSHIR